MRRAFRFPFSRRRLARDIDDEIAFHLDTRIARLVASGRTPDDARREALAQFGDVETVRVGMLALSEQREAAARRASFMDDLRHDLAYGVRTLRRNASFSALVIGGLALGIGANATIFSLIDAVLLRELPVARPHELVTVGDPEMATSAGVGLPMAVSFSYPLYRDVRDGNRVFTGVLASGAARRIDVRIDRTAREPEHPRGRFVSGNYFSVLGVRAAIGATLDSSDDVAGTAPRATISHAYWTRRFDRDSGVVGRTIVVNGASVVVTGVTAPAFTGDVVGSATDIWLPVATHDVLRPNDRRLDDRRSNWLLLIGRLRPGLSLSQARAPLTSTIEASIMANATSRQLLALRSGGIEYAISSGARGLSVIRPQFAAPLMALMFGVALLLGVVCVNVANLLLARGIARRRELSLRLAIGANRSRIVRQLLTEGLLLAIASGGVATLFAWWGSKAVVALASDGTPVSLTVGPNASVMAFTAALSGASIIVFGLVPALRSSRIDLSAAMRAQSRSIAQGARFGRWLIATQVAISLVLVASASTLTRSLRAADSRDLGLDRDHLLVADVDIHTPGYVAEPLATAVHRVRDRVIQIPGVAAVSWSENGLFSGSEWHSTVNVAGFTPRVPDDSVVAHDNVGAGYARAIGARIVAGRDLSPSDEEVLPRVAMVNTSFVRFYFGDRNPVGQIFRFNDSTRVRIVGVIADVRGQSLDAPIGSDARRVYLPYLHPVDRGNTGQPDYLRLLVRATGDPEPLVERVRREITAADPSLPVDGVRPLSALVRTSIRQERLVARIATALGVLALLLAAIGLYGVTSYTIARRTSEIGVRLALGARRLAVVRLVLHGVLRPVVLGAVLGVPLAMIAMRLLERHLTGVTTDGTSVVIAVAVLLASAIAAGIVPALAASRIDPILAIRTE